ncbi:MAG: hypothetical protein HQL35_08350 [Alphaproteobacteria bacterium]|nr:hypothetical protein [Alphaproteobacteria bacterium]
MIEPVLKALDGDRAGYFADVVAKIEADPRTARHPNFVYLLLKETVGHLPAHLDKDELIQRLFAFIDAHARDLERVVFDPDFVHDPSVVKAVTDAFVLDIVELTLEHYDRGDIDTHEPSVQKFTWPYRAEDLVDAEDETALECVDARPAYTGPERRKSR